MAKIKYFKIKAIILVVLVVNFTNSFLIYNLSGQFFEGPDRLFLMVLVNQIYFIISGIVIYLAHEKMQNKERIDELDYLFRTLKKWEKKTRN